jgi:hypothetical protein
MITNYQAFDRCLADQPIGSHLLAANGINTNSSEQPTYVLTLLFGSIYRLHAGPNE